MEAELELGRPRGRTKTVPGTAVCDRGHRGQYSGPHPLRETEIWIFKIGHRRDVYAERAYRDPPEDLSVSEPE